MADPIAENAQRHQTLLRELNATDYAPPTLVQMKACLDSTNASLTRERKALSTLQENTKKEFKDWHKIKDRTSKRLWVKVTNPSSYREKLSEREEKEEREYVEAFGKEQACQARIETLSGQVEELKPQIRELRLVAARHRELRDELNALYERVFKGPTPEYPSEDALERDVAEALKAYDEIQSHVTNEERANMLLRQASQFLARAEGSTQSALSASRVDMLGGGAMWDMIERSHLADAQRAADQARMVVMQAQHLQPAIGQMGRVDMPQGNIMSDVLFDNFWTDHMFHTKIQRAAADLSRTHQQLQGVILQSARHRDEVAAQAAERQKVLDRKREELRDLRRRIMESAAAAAGEGTWQAPPPVYSHQAAADETPAYAPPSGAPAT